MAPGGEVVCCIPSGGRPLLECVGDSMCCSGGLPCVGWLYCGGAGVAGAAVGVVMLRLPKGDKRVV